MLEQTLTLPCGAILKNRIVKSAMSEQLALPGKNQPTKQHICLYKRWAEGGSGLLISGNIMVDKSCLGTIQDVAIEDGNECREELKAWAKAVQDVNNDTHLWMQINHPGKQTHIFVNPWDRPLAPSEIDSLGMFFRTPRALTESEILKIIKSFATNARIAKETGFTGVQIHAAHGYLISQFLSPKHNQRKDQWGGSLENRMRFVVGIYKAMRDEVGSGFPIGIKINSKDFQVGGFSEKESLEVVGKLSELGVDLIEISGGTYEKTVMMNGVAKKDSTKKREAYFLEYCEKIRTLNVRAPILLTGGFRTKDGMIDALKSGACDLIGTARPHTIDCNFSNKLLNSKEGENFKSPVKQIRIGWGPLDSLPIDILWHTGQIRRLGLNLEPNPNANPIMALLELVRQNMMLGYQFADILKPHVVPLCLALVAGLVLFQRHLPLPN